ncbi:ABC1 kinase family protein [Nakamurella leprariae]|uniref:AarF/ABC1/UbiB kinase family protein n=1 Tax=Nakamurella leprariae TaxID=2803911 RepID=A0A938YBR7_9ACTN|nr:AarF/UbiB family protein [Nakamurella leprariae]MBM9466909.1 AarF/ABC1/UbiB kinase family protein [Nakamurella leprariae]
MWWNLILSLLLMGVLGVVTGRVLGIRRGPARAITAGLLGWIIGQICTGALAPGEISVRERLEFGLADLGFAFLATMLLSVGLELLLRPRRPTARLSLANRMRAGSTVARRIWQVTRIAQRQGLTGWRVASRAGLGTPETARRIRLFLEEAGGVFVKFGQIAATRSDLLPPGLVEELSHLQARVRPFPVEDVLEEIEDELRAPVAELFPAFDPVPLAAASIGQIHSARLPDGRDVVVKVRRPGVEINVARDTAVLRWVSKVAVRRSAAARQLGLVQLADEVVSSLRRELDFVHEAANGRAFRDTLPPVPGVQVPAVVETVSTTGVLVLERVEGRPLSDPQALVDAESMGVDRADLAARLFRSFLGSVIRTGIFHADPHPGNVLLDRQGTLWLIDFGAVGILDPVTHEAVALMGIGVSTGEPSLVTRALRTMAGGSGHAIDSDTLTAELSRLLSEQRHAGGFDPRVLQQIIDVMGHHQIPVPPALTILGRAMVTIEGTLRVISPRFDVAASAVTELGGRDALPTSPGDLRDMLRKETLRTLPSLRSLPALTEDLALQLRSGRMSVQVDPISDRVRSEVGGWVDRVLFAAVGAVGLLASTGMLVAATFADGRPGVLTLQIIGYFGLASSGIMLMRVVAQALQRQGISER